MSLLTDVENACVGLSVILFLRQEEEKESDVYQTARKTLTFLRAAVEKEKNRINAMIEEIKNESEDDKNEI